MRIQRCLDEFYLVSYLDLGDSSEWAEGKGQRKNENKQKLKAETECRLHE